MTSEHLYDMTGQCWLFFTETSASVLWSRWASVLWSCYFNFYSEFLVRSDDFMFVDQSSLNTLTCTSYLCKYCQRDCVVKMTSTLSTKRSLNCWESLYNLRRCEKFNDIIHFFNVRSLSAAHYGALCLNQPTSLPSESCNHSFVDNDLFAVFQS